MNPVEAIIRGSAQRYGIDPLAALAVASVEGGVRYGGLGDQGTSFGPFQLHVGGALPAGRSAGWASSPAGIDYALSRIAASGARGLHGRAAVDAIVRNFERPADPATEVVRAFARYGGAVPQVPASATGNTAAAAAPAIPPPGAAAAPPSMNLAPLLNAANRAVGLPTLSPRVFTVAQTPAGRPVPFARDHGATPSPHEGHVVELAKQFLGTPYSWGGGGPGGPSKGTGRGANTVGFDCSSFVQFLAAKQGVTVPRTTFQQWKTGTPVPRNKLQPGDVVFFYATKDGPDHEGVYLGHGQFIHAPHTGDVVKISRLASMSGVYVGARRLI